MDRGSGKRLQPALLQAVIDHITNRERDCDIVRATRVNRKTITKLRLSLEYWRVLYLLRTVRCSRLATLQQAQLNRLKEYLISRPQAYLKEIRD